LFVLKNNKLSNKYKKALVTIRKVENEQDKMRFIRFPWSIYKGNKFWVPPLIFDVRNNLNPLRNPFFKHAEMDLFLAESNGEIAGRIAAIKNDNHNKFHNEKAGFFGFFETINNEDVADQLFETACEWCKNKGLDKIIGPMNPSTNDDCGLLVNGFELSPVIMMPFNHPYYEKMIEGFGFEKAKDLFAYFIGRDVINNEKAISKLERLASMIKSRQDISIRKLNLPDLDSEVKRIEEIYNNAWEYNWGFVPMTTEEFDYAKKSLKSIVDPDYVFFAEVNGVPAGFSLSLPDFNQVLKRLNGRLFPFGIFKLISGKKKIDLIRVVIMGVKHEYQKRGIDSVFYLETIKEGVRKGVKGAEISWILEDNTVMRQTIEKLGGTIYKTYRVYSKSIN
jgi:hypothetical protein